MKVTFVLPGTRICGGVKSTFILANGLQERGHEVTVVYPLIPLRSSARGGEFRVLINRLRGLAGNLTRGEEVKWFDLKAGLQRVTDLSEKNISSADIIVATWWSNAYDISAYGPDKGLKFYFIRDYEIWGGPEEQVNGSYRLSLNRIATSTSLCNLISEKFGVEVMGPLPNGLDHNIFHRKTQNIADKNFKRIGMLYRVAAPRKGMEDGFKAYSIIHKRNPDTKLVLFGSETPPRLAQELADELGEIEIMREPGGDKLSDIYNSLDIFLFPSKLEGFGNPPMEAMACGTACVTTPVGGIPDYSIDGKTAIWVEPGNPEAMADAVCELLEDGEKRMQIADAGCEYVKHFTWERAIEQLEKMFREKIEAARRLGL